MATEKCANCGKGIQRIRVFDVFPRWIHLDGKMHCRPDAPSGIATPKRRAA